MILLTCYTVPFNKLLIETCCYLGEYSKNSIDLLIEILKNPFYHQIYETILRSLFLMGRVGIEALIDAASNCCSEWDSFILYV